VLAGLGAKVTSIDISEPQIETARSRAAALGLQVDFVRADVVDLSVVPDAAFDVIYTGGHVAVWVSDLRRYYGEAGRILKSGGLLIVSEYQPFRRVWGDSASRLEIGFITSIVDLTASRPHRMSCTLHPVNWSTSSFTGPSPTISRQS
jgi:ubiquinone/menaquinone biosynthesis C-methylase UbiE